jgi:2-hydroxy-3-keto-5-methylthiopentenyl-1-phosphate phosphatase
LNPLAFLWGVRSIDEGKATIETKNGTQEVDVLKGFEGCEIKVAIQKKWNDYTKSYRPQVAAVFSKDGRSAKEIVAKSTEAKQIQWYLSDKFKDIDPEGGVPEKKETPQLDTDFDDVF